MAKKNGSTPPGNRGFSSEAMERLEHFYSLPIAERVALLAENDPKLAAEHLLNYEEEVRVKEVRARRNKPETANLPELTRLHRLAQDEAELVFDFRLLSDEAKQAVSSLARSMGGYADAGADNVVSIRTAG